MAERTAFEACNSVAARVLISAELMPKGSKLVAALDDDDVAVLDLVSRTGGDLTKPRGVSGSAAVKPDADDFTREGIIFYHSF